MAKGDKADSSVLRYLRSIDTKLGRLNKQLTAFLSAAKTPKGKRQRKILWAHTQAEVKKLQKENPDHDVFRVLVAGTPAEAKELQKKNPNSQIIITGVPRNPRSYVVRSSRDAKPRTKSRIPPKVV